MAPSKKQNKGQDIDLDQYLAKIQPKKFSNDQAAGYFLVAFILSLVPAYLYATVFDLTLGDYGIVYLIVVLSSSVLLTLSYRNVEQGTFAALSANNKGKTTKDDNKLYLESISWSFFLNNAIFAGLFFFFGFYMLKTTDTLYNYILSMVFSAVITWKLSESK